MIFVRNMKEKARGETMVKKPVSINVKVELDDEFFDGIICTMFEGGSNYWIDHIIVKLPDGVKPQGTPLSEWASSAINKGGTVHIYPSEENGFFSLTKDKLTRGLKRWLKAHPSEVSLINENGKNTLDGGDIDAGIADNILQYALFGKPVYG